MSAENDHGFRQIEPMPRTFLSLAPAVSNSYPSSQSIKPATSMARRSSSLSSAGSMKILKLGPVHWGEHVDEHKDDFHEGGGCNKARDLADAHDHKPSAAWGAQGCNWPEFSQ
ncbi:uncharacterized protein B0I36DRAFT_364642 [Microdochium trichocladiopsis]|uniref:Uncharacterized protein n=1 Tax=Microdochium trichocladiopsis TaxID=1682393 RepID=A0A9P8Y228_9PEZI|nr:uncharacterized protein B0I36DRAFT_364642 [Microdochium trichocladiopsis]KAH7027439.1 hypothetical protein B0I36DRAFT_364642 [Microdochium trichocladiopsis]